MNLIWQWYLPACAVSAIDIFKLKKAMKALEISNLSKRYKSGVHALDNVNFSIEDGDFVGLLGPNGAGKSTLINTISGANSLESGKIEIYGLDIEKHKEEAKMLIGVVPQELSFDAFFTVNETLALQSGYYGIANNQKRIDEILEKLSLSDKKNSNTRALSGGMKRRLLIAQALVHNPKILILDEPTAGVDVELRLSLWKYVRELNADGMTILLTTHYLEEAESLCNNIAIINFGKIIARDTTNNLVKSLGGSREIKIFFDEELPQIPSAFLKFNPTIADSKLLAFSLSGEKSFNEVVDALKEAALGVHDIEIAREKLEDIFIKLTYENLD
jgi:ABC-2 type transport system ATP-binding protein